MPPRFQANGESQRRIHPAEYFCRGHSYCHSQSQLPCASDSPSRVSPGEDVREGAQEPVFRKWRHYTESLGNPPLHLEDRLIPGVRIVPVMQLHVHLFSEKNHREAQEITSLRPHPHSSRACEHRQDAPRYGASHVQNNSSVHRTPHVPNLVIFRRNTGRQKESDDDSDLHGKTTQKGKNKRGLPLGHDSVVIPEGHYRTQNTTVLSMTRIELFGRIDTKSKSKA